MTAISITEAKSSNEEQSQTAQEGKHPRRGCNRKTVAVAVLIALCLTVTVISVGFVVWKTRHDMSDDRQEWISWTRVTGTIEIHESALIDVREQTMMMVSAEAYKIHEDNSMALHDFNTGKVALRDFNAQLCLVGNIEIPDFQTLQKMLEKRQDKKLPLQTMKKARLDTRNMTSSELGPILSRFCEGVPALWYTMISNTETKRDVNKVWIAEVNNDRMELLNAARIGSIVNDDGIVSVVNEDRMANDDRVAVVNNDRMAVVNNDWIDPVFRPYPPHLPYPFPLACFLKRIEFIQLG